MKRVLLSVLLVAGCQEPPSIEGSGTIYEDDCMEITSGGINADGDTVPGEITFGLVDLKACNKKDENGEPLEDCPKITQFSFTIFNDSHPTNDSPDADNGEVKKSTIASNIREDCASIGAISASFNQNPPYNPKYEIITHTSDGEVYRETGSLTASS